MGKYTAEELEALRKETEPLVMNRVAQHNAIHSQITTAKDPLKAGEIVYVPRDNKLIAIVALRRFDTDDLAWFEVSEKPFEFEVDKEPE